MLNYRFTYETIKNIVLLLSNLTNVDLEMFFSFQFIEKIIGLIKELNIDEAFRKR